MDLHGESPHIISFLVPLPRRLQRLALLTCARNLDIIKSVVKKNPFLVGYFVVNLFLQGPFGAGLPEDPRGSTHIF